MPHGTLARLLDTDYLFERMKLWVFPSSMESSSGRKNDVAYAIKGTPTFEEKQTDVNIALQLLQLAILDQYDRAIILSGDTDLIPAIKAVRLTFPHKQIGVILPIGRSSEDLLQQADFKHKMREHHLASSRFPDIVTLKPMVQPWNARLHGGSFRP